MRNVPEKFEDYIRSLQVALAALPPRSDKANIVSHAKDFVRWVNENDSTNNLASEEEWRHAYAGYAEVMNAAKRFSVRVFAKLVGDVELSAQVKGGKRVFKAPDMAEIEFRNFLAALQLEGWSRSSLSSYAYQLRHFLHWAAESSYAQTVMSEEGWLPAVAAYMKSIAHYTEKRKRSIQNCIRRFGIFLEYEPAE